MSGTGTSVLRLTRTGLVAAGLVAVAPGEVAPGEVGTAAAAPIDLAIPDIQGAGQRSAHVDRHVRTAGVVAATAGNGFYL